MIVLLYIMMNKVKDLKINTLSKEIIIKNYEIIK
jgi:hypothetical protein